MKDSEEPWWQIPDFYGHDIKGVWELSRWGWAVEFSLAFRSGSVEAGARLDSWLADWCRCNPAYSGPNWKCGQEASIRVLHLLMSAQLLAKALDHTAVAQLLTIHLRRIEPTVGYAIAQDNNHATTEAAALFAGGVWLVHHGSPDAARWLRLGRRLLERSGRRLIGPDGSFSQYSINYHRLMLDAFCVAELCRRANNEVPFTPVLTQRLRAATTWLHTFIQRNGDVPNLGSGDGARLVVGSGGAYRDYRQSAALAANLFCGKSAFPEVAKGLMPVLQAFGVTTPSAPLPEPISIAFDHGGTACMRQSQWTAVIRYPRFRFRPGQSDLLHLDLWHDDANILRDAGTYSYAASTDERARTEGVMGHNTAQFDGREQMPRLGRFLYGRWPSTSHFEMTRLSEGADQLTVGYRDYRGAAHLRSLVLTEAGIRVVDEVAGFESSAVLRWHLPPCPVALDGSCAVFNGFRLTVTSNAAISRLEVVDGYESRHYLQQTHVPILEVETRSACRIVSELNQV